MAQNETTAHHPTPKQYVQIALFLALLTGIEVALFYVEEGVGAIGPKVTGPILILLSFIKFVIVVGWYMHLRYEKSLVSKFFTVGAAAALVLYGAVLVALGAIPIG